MTDESQREGARQREAVETDAHAVRIALANWCTGAPAPRDGDDIRLLAALDRLEAMAELGAAINYARLSPIYDVLLWARRQVVGLGRPEQPAFASVERAVRELTAIIQALDTAVNVRLMTDPPTPPDTPLTP